MADHGYDVDVDMMRGFEPLEGYFKKHPLSFSQGLQFYSIEALLTLLKYTYAPIKHMFNEPDILRGIDACQGYDMQVRGSRTRESHGEHYLCEADVKEFEKTGILGPFPLLSTKEASEIEAHADTLHERDFDGVTLFGNEKTRNILKKHDMWNLNYSGIYQAHRYPKLWDVLASKEITQKIASLIGDDLIVWRSQFFEKKPGEIGTFWHQTGTFRESSENPKLKATTPINDSLVQLTAWVALTDVTVKNGCMRMLPRSFCDGRFERIAYNIKDQAKDYLLTLDKRDREKALRAIKFTPGNFIKTQLVYEMALQKVPDLFDGYEVRDLEMKAGEFIIFSSLNTHGSFPNATSNDRRLSVAGRYTTNDVKVYDGFTHDVFPTPEGDFSFPVEPLACMQVLGEDKFGYNRMAQYPHQPPRPSIAA